MLHPAFVNRPAKPSAPVYVVGQRMVDHRGEWVLLTSYVESGSELPSRVLAGSLAHAVLAVNDPRLLPVSTTIETEG